MTAILLLLGLPLATTALAGWIALRHLTWKERRANLLLATACLLATIGFFWQVLFLPDRALPVGGGDLVSFLWPAYHFAGRSLQDGVLPFWNPHLYSGMPFAADIQNGLFYPPNLLVWLLVDPFDYRAMQLLAMSHLLIATWGMAFCLRSLGVGNLAAFGGAVVYGFSGFMVAHIGHINLIATAAWAPWALGLLIRSFGAGGWLAVIGAGTVYGVALLAGHPQMAFLLGGLLVLTTLWAGWRGISTRQSWPRLAFDVAILFTVALGTAAVQLLPFIELTGFSLRQTLTYAEATAFPLERRGLITFLLPHFFGPSLGDFWGLTSLTESYGHVGIVSLPMAALGFLGSRGNRWRVFWVLLGLGGLVLALGERTVIHGWLYELLPGFERLRVPGRFLFYLTFAAAVLTAFGLNALREGSALRQGPPLRLALRSASALLLLIVLTIPALAFAVLTNQDKDALIFRRTMEALDSGLVSALLLGLFVALPWARYRRPASWAAPAIAALILVDLFSANQGLNLTDQDLTAGFQHESIEAYVASQPGPFRVDPVTGIADRLQPAWSLIHGYDDVYGLFNPLALRDYQRYWENLGSRSNPAYDVLGARFLIGAKDVPLDQAKFEMAFSDHPILNVYRNRTALPLALIIPNVEELPSEELWRRLREGPWDPRDTLLVTETLPSVSATTGSRSQTLEEWARPDANSLHIKIRTTAPGYLLISQNHYPGWHALVDGQTTPLFRVDGVFTALLLSGGTHTVELRFEPTAWPLALGLSLLTWLTVLTLTGWSLMPKYTR